MMGRLYFSAVGAAALLIGCTVGPNYRRPAVPTPASFRSPTPLPPDESSSLADLKWWEVFRDENLQDLERTALAQNYDLRDAVEADEAGQREQGEES